MTITHNVSVDFINRDSIQVVNFVQHDQNIPVLSVDLYSGGSKLEIDFSKTTAKIYLRVSLPNGAFADIESTETSGDGPKSGKISTVTFGLGYNVFPAYGAAKAIVLITEKAAGSTEYTNRAGSSPIVFMIDKDPIQDGSEESLDQYYGLRGYIEDISGNVVKKTALSIPKEGEIIPPSTMVYAPSIIINKTGKVTRKKWYPTDIPGSGEPNTDSVSSGDFVRRNSSKEILVPWNYTDSFGEQKTEYKPAISAAETDSKINSCLDQLLEALSSQNMFAVQAKATDDVEPVHNLTVYITKKNSSEVSFSIGNDGKSHIVTDVSSVRFKNENEWSITVEFVMNGLHTTLMVPGYDDHVGAGEETVTLSGNMTVLAVNK